MYTHVGDGIILKNKGIIGIFDIKTIYASRENKRIQFNIKERNLDGKSIILMDNNGKYVEEVSKISVSTLKKRVEKGLFLNKREVKKWVKKKK